LGEFKAAPDIRQNGPAAGGGYVLPAGPKVKEGRNQPAPLTFKCAAPDQPKSGTWTVAANHKPVSGGVGNRGRWNLLLCLRLEAQGHVVRAVVTLALARSRLPPAP